MDSIPFHCQQCYNCRDDECKALSEFSEDEDCFAFVGDARELLKRLEKIKEYSLKKGDKIPEKMAQEIHRLRKTSSSVNHREILQAFFEEGKRGNHKGGSSEKEKAPNKPRAKKDTIWRWDEL